MTTKKLTVLSLFIATGLVLQYLESRIIISTIPGGKLGLANIMAILNIFMFGGGNALAVVSLRSLLGALLFGGAMTVPYSLSGAFFSTLAMWGIKRYLYPKVSLVGMSILGAVVHNLSQLAVAAVFYGTVYVFSYLPVLLAVSVVSGFITGFATHIFKSRMKGIIL